VVGGEAAAEIDREDCLLHGDEGHRLQRGQEARKKKYQSRC
jgi:hypothetical protein